MMAKTDDRGTDRPQSLAAVVMAVLLSVILGHVALFGLAGVNAVVQVLIAANTFFGPWAWQTVLVLGKNLLMFVVAIGAVLWLKPWQAIAAASAPREEDTPGTLSIGLMSALLAFLVLAGLSAAAGTVGAVLFDPRIKHPVSWVTWAFFAWDLTIAATAIWGLSRLKPWIKREPISPSTRKTNALFGLSGLVCVPGVLTLTLSATSKDNPMGLFSNSPVVPWIALFAIVSWLLSMVIGWWWYFSADEHEREAYDFGSVVGAGLFTALAPVWWIAARAGLVPQPDAMVLWLITMAAITIGWMWRRSR